MANKSLSCPRCKSENIKLVDYQGVKCLICKNCGYDETQQYEIYPEQKTSQKAKSRYSPYKTGGSYRAKK